MDTGGGNPQHPLRDDMAVAHYKVVLKLAWNNQIPTNFWGTECMLLLCNHCFRREISVDVLHFEGRYVV